MGLREVGESTKYYMHCPGKVTKSFELTEKMRKLIEKLLDYLYTFRKLIMFSRCALHKHDSILRRKRAGNAEVHI